MSKIISRLISDSAITTDKLNDLAVTTAKVGSGAITTAKIADSAVDSLQIATSAVATAKIASGAVTAAKLADGSVGNVAVASGIDAVKLADGSISNTEFQYLNGVTSAIQTQLDAKADEGSPVFTGAIDGSASTNVDLATTNTASTVDIGTGTGANTINIGGANSTVNIIGSVNNQNVTNMNVTDKLITINDGGAAASGGSSGIEVEEDGSATAYVQTSSDRNSWKLKAPNTNGIATLTPGASDSNVVLDTATQTLTNKTLTTPSTDVVTLDGQASAPSNPSSGFYKMYVDDTTQKLSLLDSAGTVTTVGSGSGSGEGINYLSGTNADAEANSVGDWVITKNTSATAAPDNGFSSAATTNTWTVTSTNPHRGTYSFLYTLGALGNQAYVPFTIDASDKGKVLQISAEISVNSGTYADGDCTVWVYDVTNGVFIQPAPYRILNSSLIEKYTFEFQSSSSSTSYRLLFHQAAASTAVLKIDRISVGPQAKLYGSPITDWVSYTPTITTASGTMTNYTTTCLWRRVGDTVEITGTISFTGSPGTWTRPRIQLPTSFSIDTNKLDSASASYYPTIGFGTYYELAGDTPYPLRVVYYSTTAIELHANNAGTSYLQGVILTSSVPATMASGDRLIFRYKAPILGWSSSVVMSSDADTRVVDFRAYKATDQTGVNTNNSTLKVAIDTVTIDSHGAFSTANNRYVIPVAGDYVFSGLISVAGTNVTANRHGIHWYKNGILVEATAETIISSGNRFRLSATSSPMRCIAGDYIEMYFFGEGNNSASNLTISGGSTVSMFSGYKLSGPAQIAASETVVARYTTAAGLSVANTGDTLVDFETKDYDTHGAVTVGTWKFTAPIAGKYRIYATIQYNAALYAVGNDSYLSLYKNGVEHSFGPDIDAWAAVTVQLNGVYDNTLHLNAGDYIHIEAVNSRSAGATTLVPNNKSNYITIERIGN